MRMVKFVFSAMALLFFLEGAVSAYEITGLGVMESREDAVVSALRTMHPESLATPEITQRHFSEEETSSEAFYEVKIDTHHYFVKLYGGMLGKSHAFNDKRLSEWFDQKVTGHSVQGTSFVSVALKGFSFTDSSCQQEKWMSVFPFISGQVLPDARDSLLKKVDNHGAVEEKAKISLVSLYSRLGEKVAKLHTLGFSPENKIALSSFPLEKITSELVHGALHEKNIMVCSPERLELIDMRFKGGKAGTPQKIVVDLQTIMLQVLPIQFVVANPEEMKKSGRLGNRAFMSTETAISICVAFIDEYVKRVWSQDQELFRKGEMFELFKTVSGMYKKKAIEQSAGFNGDDSVDYAKMLYSTEALQHHYEMMSQKLFVPNP